MSQQSPPSKSGKPTKADRREEARLQAQRLREEQQRASRRQRTIAISLLVVSLAVVGGVIAWILSNQPEPPPDFSEAEDPLSLVVAPSTANDEGGIPTGASGVAGDAAAGEGAVVVAVYADFMCPRCGEFEVINGPVLDDLRASGDIVLENRPVSILDRAAQGSQYSTRSATAAAVVADQAPEQYLAFTEAMFAQQPSEGTGGHSDEQIAAIAQAAGVPEDVTATIADGSYFTGSDSFRHWVAAATEHAIRSFPDGFGTPTVLVDGENISDLGADWRVPGALAAAIEQARG